MDNGKLHKRICSNGFVSPCVYLHNCFCHDAFWVSPSDNNLVFEIVSFRRWRDADKIVHVSVCGWASHHPSFVYCREYFPCFSGNLWYRKAYARAWQRCEEGCRHMKSPKASIHADNLQCKHTWIYKSAIMNHLNFFFSIGSTAWWVYWIHYSLIP